MISVIIPIYNSEKYLSRCIDSILMQTYKDIEILLVDDGSTDNTKEICIDYSNKDSRVKYLHKDNSGVSATRNYGIEHASGEWIIFIDSDDYFSDANVFNRLMEVVNKNPNVMPIFNFISLKDNNVTEKQNEFVIGNPDVEDIMANCIAGVNHSTNLTYMFRAVWCKMFNKKIVDEHNIRFDEKMYMGEDAVFLIEYVQYIESIEDIHTYGLIYRIHDDSSSRKYKTDLLSQAKLELTHFDNILSNYNSKLLTTARAEYIWIIYKQLFTNEVRGNRKHIEGKKWLEFNKEHLKEKVDYSLMSKSNHILIYIYKFLPFMLIPLITIYSKLKKIK